MTSVPPASTLRPGVIEVNNAKAATSAPATSSQLRVHDSRLLSVPGKLLLGEPSSCCGATLQVYLSRAPLQVVSALVWLNG